MNFVYFALCGFGFFDSTCIRALKIGKPKPTTLNKKQKTPTEPIGDGRTKSRPNSNAKCRLNRTFKMKVVH